MFEKLLNKTKTCEQPADDGTAPAPQEKKSLYRRYEDAKTGRSHQISDADLKKYTGKTRAELGDWAASRPGVAGNQAAGKLAMGPATGLGGAAAGAGYGGWGPSANALPKYPPAQKTEADGKLSDVE